ncbi:MAG TPA: hypothetical protein DCO77_06965 [Nitrospiraceae bacterium]|nr:hypothetical protein [Nitrospiraceae bacterium]
MYRKHYLIVSGSIFLLVALLHIARILFSVLVEIGAWIVPMWISWGGFLAAAALSLWAYRLARQ